MQRKDLEALGLDGEAITKVLDAHHKELTEVKEQLETEKTRAETLEKDLTGQKSEVEKLSKSTGTLEEKTAEIEKLKQTMAEAEQARKKEVSDLQSKLDNSEFEKYIDLATTKYKAKRKSAVLAELDIGSLKKSKNREADVDAAIKELVDNEETAFLFGEPEAQPTGGKKTFPPKTNPSGGEEIENEAVMRSAMGLPPANED